MTLLHQTARLAMDLTGTILDSAASALHRAAGEPSRVAELEAERLAFLYELDHLKARGDRMRDAARLANQRWHKEVKVARGYMAADASEIDRLRRALADARGAKSVLLSRLPCAVGQTWGAIIDAATGQRDALYQTIRERDEARAELKRCQAAWDDMQAGECQPGQGGAG